MITDPESVATALRPLSGVRDVDVVQFPSGKELWIVLGDPVSLDRLRKASDRFGYIAARRGLWVSKLPRSLAEMIWEGVVYVITKHIHASGRQECSARIVKDLKPQTTLR